MVLKFQGYKKCVNSTRDKMCFRNAGERITALNSFRRAESYERGTDRDLIFLEIGTKSNRNPGRPKQGPNNAHLVEYSNMGNCYHQQFQFSVENIDNFNDFDETIDISNDFEETIENFNGFEETIENFGGHHHH